jgi:acyl carrier protein
MDEIKNTLRSFILKEFLPGENPDELTDSTPLISGGILDSLATLKLVSFLEEHYKIVFQAHETDIEYLDTIDAISKVVANKCR